MISKKLKSRKRCEKGRNNENKVEKSLKMDQDDSIDPVYKISRKKTVNEYIRKRWE